jgi:two-component system, OmpR family, alkaline phosphatase synthesis response regulator PhoP
MQLHKILIVEDDPNINELIRITILSPSYSIICVDNGIEALAKLIQEKPDLVLLDILIPEPDGWEIYKTIRSNPDLNHTGVIILTALLFRSDFLQAKRILPTDMVMRKPFELDELKANVKRLLDGACAVV